MGLLYKLNNCYYVLVKEATFYIRRHADLKETFSFASFHDGWYLAVGSKVGGSVYKMKVAYSNNTKEFDLQSSFVLKPQKPGIDPKEYCAEETITPTIKPSNPLTPSPATKRKYFDIKVSRSNYHSINH